MCGINGFSWEDTALVSEMNQVTRNRGPDDHGAYTDGAISLGHSRLSIIDLTENGHQPMCNEDQSVWIVYNGEIYNYQDLRSELVEKGHLFKSDTDTEVIIHAYEEFGLDFVNRFNGMWAFCIYDKNRNSLVLGRDQFGIKPLYYHVDSEGLIFSSMISALLCHDIPAVPNDHAIMQYLSFNLEDHDSFTFFSTIEKIPTDTLFIYDLAERTYRLQRWYEPADREAIDVDAVRDLFIESVRLRTIADVPVGSCLSGGVDSTAIVCILNSILPEEFNTYSLISPGFALDESRYILEVGKRTNVRQFFTEISDSEFLEEFPDFVRAQEEPVTGMSPYAQYRVMKLASTNKAKVLLDGQGGDEIFAGYIYYYSYYFYELLASLKIGSLVREMVKYRKNFKNTFPHRMFAFLLLPGFAQRTAWHLFSPSWINHRYLKKVGSGVYDPRWKRMTLKESLYLTLFTTAMPHLLRWEDKNSMRWSIESRPPFLDVNLVESAMALPSESKLRDGQTKAVFKEAVKDYLPSMIAERKDKIGFATPSDEFFRKDNIVDFCREIIYSDSFRSRPYWNWEKVEEEYRRHLDGTANIGDTIWKWINLEIWLREFF